VIGWGAPRGRPRTAAARHLLRERMDGGAVTGGGSAAFAAGERLTTGTAKSHDVRAANIIAAKGA